MGFKTATVFVTTEAPDYFSRNPTHSPEKAAALIAQLGLGQANATGELYPFTECMYPPEKQFCLGAYEKGFILSDQRVYEFFEPDNALKKKILSAYPTANILTIILHSVVDLYGYDIYQKGKRVRALTGSADDGVIEDFGEIQPEEQAIFADSKMVDGERIFTMEFGGEKEELGLSSVGESLVFAVAKSFLGYEIDRVLDPEVNIEPMLQTYDKAGENKGHRPNQTKSDAAGLLANVMKFFGGGKN